MYVEVFGKFVGFFYEKKKGVDCVFVDYFDFLVKVWGKIGFKFYGEKFGYDFADN